MLKIPEDIVSNFLSLNSKIDLSVFFKKDLRTINYLLYVLREDDRYETFSISKRCGDTRIIRSPIKPIKDLQKLLSFTLLEIYKPRKPVHGFVKNRSIISNANIHKNKRWVFRTDIDDFFPSINFGRVRGLFLSEPFKFNADIATVLSQLCTFKNELPQGAPTSPIISNFICRRIDIALIKLASQNGCHYTRYADDIVFSTNKKLFPDNIGYSHVIDGKNTGFAGNELSDIIRDNGFNINNGKSYLLGVNNRQIVTGLVVNKFVNIKRNYIRSVRSLLHLWEIYGDDAALDIYLQYNRKNNRPPHKIDKLNLSKILTGKIQHIGSVKGWDNELYLKLSKKLSKLDEKFVFDLKKLSSHKAGSLSLFTEGESDYNHIKAILNIFKDKALYLDLRIDTELTFPKDKTIGSAHLLNTCKQLSSVKNEIKRIFIFDRDEENIIKEVSNDRAPYKDWGNNVYSFALPVPKHRLPDEKICIELYYTDEFIYRKDSRGHRLYFRNEFDANTGKHLKESLYTTYQKHKAIVLENNVFDITTNKNVALPKTHFSRKILNNEEPYINPEIEPFKLVFDILHGIKEQK